MTLPANTSKTADAITAYLQPKKNLEPGEQKGQLVINDKVLVCRKLTKLERFGKIFGLGPAAAGQVLRFVNDNKIVVKDLNRLQSKLEKHTIRGFIKSFFYPKPPKATKEPEPSASLSSQSALKPPKATEEPKLSASLSSQLQSVPGGADPLTSSQSYLKIGDEINFNQTSHQRTRYPQVVDKKCTVIAVQYDEDKKDTVYTFQRILFVKNGKPWHEQWKEPHKQLRLPDQPLKGPSIE